MVVLPVDHPDQGRSAIRSSRCWKASDAVLSEAVRSIDSRARRCEVRKRPVSGRGATRGSAGEDRGIGLVVYEQRLGNSRARFPSPESNRAYDDLLGPPSVQPHRGLHAGATMLRSVSLRAVSLFGRLPSAHEGTARCRGAACAPKAAVLGPSARRRQIEMSQSSRRKVAVAERPF